MSSSALIIAKMLLTLGLCLGFGFHQLWDLRREKAKDALKRAAKTTEGTERDPSSAAAS